MSLFKIMIMQTLYLSYRPSISMLRVYPPLLALLLRVHAYSRLIYHCFETGLSGILWVLRNCQEVGGLQTFVLVYTHICNNVLLGMQSGWV